MSVQPVPQSQVESLVQTLERDGIVPVPSLVPPDALRAMQRAFELALERPSWNTWRGFEQTDRHRRMVEHILTLDPAFQELGLHPLVREVMGAYLGPTYTLTEVRSWETVATKQNFHGWHNDAWYDHDLPEVPRELKLALYLTDVTSGYFSYIKGSHVGTRHQHWTDREVESQYADRQVDMTGPAGSTFLFDTAGIHRQSTPVLDPRWVVMFNYHDPTTPLQEIDVRQYRYHPLHLNAAFLGGLDAESERVLGFGERSTFKRHYQQPARYPQWHATLGWLFRRRLDWQQVEQFAGDAWRFVARRLGGN